jgi:hypothetical protein
VSRVTSLDVILKWFPISKPKLYPKSYTDAQYGPGAQSYRDAKSEASLKDWPPSEISINTFPILLEIKWKHDEPGLKYLS